MREAGLATYNVRDYGAKGDGQAMDTAAIQSAIDACAAAKGGRVLFPAGEYVTGTIRLKSNVTLHLAPTATILGSTDPVDYATDIARCGFVNETAIDKCLIYAEGAENIGITGTGTIDGRGWAFPVKRPDGSLGDRPMISRCFDCRHIVFEGITMKNAGAWCSHFRECEFVRCTGVKILSRESQNNDGFDFMSTSKVVVSDCIILCQDDAICFQNMHDEKPVQDVVITNCIFSTRWAAIRSGGAHRAGIRNVTVSNCVIYDTYGCGIKLQVSGNGSMENMTFSNIVMRNVSCPISLRFGNAHYNNETRDERHPWGSMRNMMFSNIWASVTDEASLKAAVPDLYPGEERECISICGIPEHPIEGITISDLHVIHPGGGTKEDAANMDSDEVADVYPEYFMWGVLPAYGLYARHVNKLTLDNVRFELLSQDYRPALVCDDVDDLDIDGLKAHAGRDVASLIRLRDTRNALIRGSRALTAVPVLVSVEGERSAAITVSGNDARNCDRLTSTGEGTSPDALN